MNGLYRRIARFESKRNEVKSWISARPHLDRILHMFSTGVFLLNMIMVIWALFAVTITMVNAGLGFIDSVPLALYALPLMAFTPSLTLSYYRQRSGLLNLLIIAIATVFFILFASLLRGFLILSLLNVTAIIIMFILAKLRPRGSIKQIGRRGIATLILLNLLGLAFPVSIYVMGEMPIAYSPGSDQGMLFIDVPMQSAQYSGQYIAPDLILIHEATSNGFGFNLRLDPADNSSEGRLLEWLHGLNSTDAETCITLSVNRSALLEDEVRSLGSTYLFHSLQQGYASALADLHELLELHNYTNLVTRVTLDMRLSTQEWRTLMEYTRSIDLIAFTSLLRATIDECNSTAIQIGMLSILESFSGYEYAAGLLVEAFVLDDYLSSDGIAMTACGVTPDVLDAFPFVEFDISRTKYSLEMNGDVGEYLVHSYASSISRIAPSGSTWSLRQGTIGNHSLNDGTNASLFVSIEDFSKDLSVSLGLGVKAVTVESLGTLYSSFGIDGFGIMRNLLSVSDSVPITYTFRVFAFRAVFIAIDAFSFLMF